MFRPVLASALHCTAGHAFGTDDGFMPLAWCQDEGQELPYFCGAEMDVRAETALAAAERFGLGIPCFAPAAGWWARIMA
jgi:hypothetical protein